MRLHLSLAIFVGFLLIFGLTPGWAGQRGVFIDSESNIRQSPGTKAKILRVSTKGVQFDILEQSGKWARIKTADGLEGWTNAINFVILKESDPEESGSAATPPDPTGKKGDAVAAGKPGTSPQTRDAPAADSPVDIGNSGTATPKDGSQTESRPRPDLRAEITRRQTAADQTPQDPVARFMLSVALLDSGDIAGAKAQIAPLKKLNATLADDLQRLSNSR